MGTMKRITNEWDLALATASIFWTGTSITDGAFEIMKQVRHESPEQFQQGKKQASDSL